MKRWMLSMGIIALLANTTKAQGVTGFFQQKKTQKQYLLQQIAALKIYSDYAQKGYAIAKDGLKTIGGFTKGEWDGHGDYFGSLEKVNPAVKQDAKVAAIITIQLKIVSHCNRTRQQANSSAIFSAEEQRYIGKVLDRVIEDGVNSLDELLQVTADGNLQLKDDERIVRIEKLYENVLDQWAFTQKFGGDTQLMAASRKREQQTIEHSRALRGFKKN